jgi:hypothetical protein
MDQMRDRLRYRVLHGTDESDVSRRVSGALDEGYELYGSPTVSTGAGAIVFAQAVILPPYATSTPRVQPVDTASPRNA